MANTKQKMKYDDLTYTQIIDPTLGGNLPKAKPVKKTTSETKKNANKTSSKAKEQSKVTKSTVKSTPKTKNTTVKASTSTKQKMQYDDLTYTQIIDPTLGGNLPKAKPVKKTTGEATKSATKTKVTVKEQSKEIKSNSVKETVGKKSSTSTKPKMKYEDLTYTQIIDPTLGGNLPKAKKDVSLTKAEEIASKDIMVDNEDSYEDSDGLSMLISTILVMALIVVGIILAAHLIK